jgi:hypothetical protein
VYEQAVEIRNDAGQRLRLRRVELRLDHATEESDTTIRMLTNLGKPPRVTPVLQ